jgi:rusticyanin
MEDLMKHIGLAAAIGTAAIIAAGLGAGAALAACGSTAHAPAPAATPAAAASPGSSSAYTYYRSMMQHLYPGAPGSMMGSGTSYGWMMSSAGYRWMMGGPAAPAWMRGSALPGFMMGTTRDPGKVIGALFAGAPGPRVTPAGATRLASQIPAGATVSRPRHTVTFSGSSVRLTIVASPSGGPDETFRVAGMVNPAIIVKPGARVSIQVINADPDTAHGLAVTAGSATSSWMPMMTARPAFPGSALWFLGNPTSAGMHAGTLTFTASTPGTYHYLCPVPGHAQKGMTGTFTVSSTT